jgi:hypothetical protein
MNCFEFHRRFAADPADRDPQIVGHSAGCPPCAAFARRILQLERSLRSVIVVDPPETLRARILLRQTCTERKAAYTRRAWWLALAASVLIVVGLVGSHPLLPQSQTLSRAVLAHVEDEPFALATHTPVDVARVNQVAQRLGTWVDDSIGAVSFASICGVGDSEGVHLVTAGDKGPITVLVMPAEAVTARLTLRDDRYEGVIVPGASGSIAIVGERGEALASVEARVRTSVHTVSLDTTPI